MTNTPPFKLGTNIERMLQMLSLPPLEQKQPGPVEHREYVRYIDMMNINNLFKLRHPHVTSECSAWPQMLPLCDLCIRRQGICLNIKLSISVQFSPFDKPHRFAISLNIQPAKYPKRRFRDKIDTSDADADPKSIILISRITHTSPFGPIIGENFACEQALHI